MTNGHESTLTKVPKFSLLSDLIYLVGFLKNYDKNSVYTQIYMKASFNLSNVYSVACIHTLKLCDTMAMTYKKCYIHPSDFKFLQLSESNDDFFHISNIVIFRMVTRKT